MYNYMNVLLSLFFTVSLINTTPLSLSAQLLNLSRCLQEAADTHSQLSGVLDRAFSVVSASYTLLHQVRESNTILEPHIT